jgi:hypothetical protein
MAIRAVAAAYGQIRSEDAGGLDAVRQGGTSPAERRTLPATEMLRS